MRIRLGRVVVVEGDITGQEVDAIVNAANETLLGGGGVDGAIHRKGGPAILSECRDLRASKYGRGLPRGQAVATTAGNLPARWVIHTVGPVYQSTVDQSDVLRSCYSTSLAVADELGATSIAFPLISAGVYGWPVDDAITQALSVLRTAETTVDEIRLVLFGQPVFALAERLIAGGDPAHPDAI
jgi:O-acetyl-ADP-ribose deacetylase (regulator of RNase III)